MASGGNSRQTGTIPKVVRNNSNIPQEVVTPTRRDIHGTNTINSSVDWLPVSEQNTRTTQNRTRKSTNIQADNEFSDLDLVNQERGSRFVPVRPQPRSLVLRQRDSMGEHSEDSFNNFMGGNSPHTSHAAIMIVNPTTPNSNQSMNASGSMNRNNMRAGSMGRDGSSYSGNTVPVCPHPINSSNNNAASNKPTNIHNNEHSADSMIYQNGNGHSNYHDSSSNNQSEALLPRSEALRAAGDSAVAACPDAVRVEQRLGQIREYIRVTSSLVESMRNSEDELKRRLKSLKQCNAVLAAHARAMDGEENCQDVVEIEPEVEEPVEEEEEDKDLQELLDTLQNLKDSEKKLEDMLEYLNDRVKNANHKIEDVCSEKNTTINNSASLEDEETNDVPVKDNTPVEYKAVTPADDDKGIITTQSSTTLSEYTSISDIKDEDVSSIVPHKEQEGAVRPTSAQSSFSAYSDNELYQNEIKTNMDLTQIRLAAALQEQQRLRKYQAEAKEQLAEIQMARNLENAGSSSHNDLSSHQDISGSSSMYTTPPNIHQPLSSSKVYGINQIGVATTLPHISENNYNWNNQGGVTKRSTSSGERDSRLDSSENRNKMPTTSAVHPDQTEIDMLRDLQMRRHHLESQVSKIQNLHTASSSLVDTISSSGGAEGTAADSRPWGGSEASEDDRLGQAASDNSIRNKVATVNVMKAELERLKSLLRTADSIQNNFGINSAIEDDNLYDNENQVTHDNVSRKRNRVSESSMSNHLPLSRRDSSSSTKNAKDGQDGVQNTKNQNIPFGLLSRLQNCISSSNKCTNVSEPHHPTSSGDLMGSELLAIQQLTDELKQAAQGLSDERRRLKHVTNRDVCTSSGSSIKSEDKKRTNSMSGGNSSSAPVSNFPRYAGPLERKQLALKAELEAKKKQLERLMSKDVDHRTNQQSSMGGEGSSNKEIPSGDASNSAVKIEASCSYQNIPMSNDMHNEYSSSEQEDDEAYLPVSHNQLNINHPSEEPSQKSPSRCSSPDNLKDEPSYFGDSTRSLDGSFISQTIKHNKLQKVNKPGVSKQQNKGILQICTSLDGNADNFQGQVRDVGRTVPEVCVGGRTVSQDMDGLRAVTQPLPDCFLGIPANNTSGTKDVCDVSNMSNTSSSSSGGDRDPVPPPMAALPTRHRHSNNKTNRGNESADSTPPQWHSPQMESQVTMWWHNKANQLQQQLELTTNLCQSLLQDKRTSQVSPSTFNSSSQAPLNQPGSMLMQNIPANVIPGIPALPQYQNNPMIGNPYYPMGGVPPAGYYPMDVNGIPPMWSYQQQQLAAQQHQVAAAAWGSAQCIQHLLTQQREISLLRSTLSNLEERMQSLNINMPRAHSTPPNINYTDNFTHPQAVRTNSVQSNLQQAAPQHVWPANQYSDNSSSTPHIPQNVGSVHPSNFTQNRAPTSKLIPNTPPIPIDHYNNQQLPANFSMSCNVFQQDLQDQINVPPLHSNVSLMNQLYNNNLPQPPINPTVAQTLQNRNPNSLVNITPHAAAISNVQQCVHPMGQPLTGQSMALNNQVPPGNRANNYWDNFRSYSRQNLLSGSTKANAGVSLTHSPHPLVERSHNTLHTGTPPGSTAVNTNTQVTNTPKRDVNLQGNLLLQPDNDISQRRGRRNLSQEAAYFTAPPDVLNVNQNLDLEPTPQSVNLLANAEILNDNRLHDTHNININRSINAIPEIIQAHSNNLNVPRSYGAYKKKSSSKLPAKNACNTGNNYASTSHNRNIEIQPESGLSNPNLASTSNGSNQEKSTTKLFDLLRENVYSEVTALISANESRPHFLIQLFRDLQQISSDTLRQRALQSIQELVSHYLSNVDGDSYEAANHGNVHNISDTHMHTNNSNENAVLQIDNEIVKFILAHHSDICTTELLEDLCHVIIASICNVSNHAYLNQRLNESFVNYRGCKVMDISDDLVMTISSILMSLHNKDDQLTGDVAVRDVTKTESATAHVETKSVLLQYRDEGHNATNTRDIHDEAVGPLCLETIPPEDMRDEACGITHNIQTNQDCNSFVPMSEPKVDLIESVENYNGDLAEADQSRHGSETTATSIDGTLETFLPDVVDTEEQTPTEAEAEWLGLDGAPTRLQMEENPGNQSDGSQA